MKGVFALVLFLPLSSTVKTSHSPVVSKIDNRLEQYTSAAQVADARIGERFCQSVPIPTTAFTRQNSVEKKKLASPKNVVSNCDPIEIWAIEGREPRLQLRLRTANLTVPGNAPVLGSLKIWLQLPSWLQTSGPRDAPHFVPRTGIQNKSALSFLIRNHINHHRVCSSLKNPNGLRMLSTQLLLLFPYKAPSCFFPCPQRENKESRSPRSGAVDLPVVTDSIRNIKSMWEKGNVFNSPGGGGSPFKVRVISVLKQKYEYFFVRRNTHQSTVITVKVLIQLLLLKLK